MNSRPIAAALAALSLFSACRADSKPTAPALGRVGSTLSADPLFDEAATATTSGPAATTTVVGRSVTTGKGSATTGAGSQPGPAATSDPRQAAQASLDSYLDGLRSEDYPASMRAATDGPRLLAYVRSMLKSVNDQAGASSTFTYGERNYASAAMTAERIVFSGRATLRQSTVTRSGETKQGQVVLGEIAVVRRGERWLVSEMVWDAKPVEYTPSTASAELGQGVKARLAGAVRFGTIAAVVIGFDADKSLAVRVEKDRLRGPGYDDASTFRTLVNGYALFHYPRHAGGPSTWSADITLSPDPARSVSMAFG